MEILEDPLDCLSLEREIALQIDRLRAEGENVGAVILSRIAADLMPGLFYFMGSKKINGVPTTIDYEFDGFYSFITKEMLDQCTLEEFASLKSDQEVQFTLERLFGGDEDDAED